MAYIGSFLPISWKGGHTIVNQTYLRGEVYFADLSPVVGSEQGGYRPVLIIQNNIGNKFSPTVIVAAITATLTKTKLPTHVLVEDTYGLEKQSIILLEQIRTIDKTRLLNRKTVLDENVMKKVNHALAISLNL
jgi:mRNA interferase MazF